jgi:transposase InsO family protein
MQQGEAIMSQVKATVILSDRKAQKRKLILEESERLGVHDASIRHGFPERTIYRWKARVKVEGLVGLLDKSSAPKNTHKINPEIVARVIEIKTQCMALNREEISAKILSEGKRISSASIGRILRVAKLVTKKVGKVKPPHKTRYEINEPGYLQIDTKEKELHGELNYQFTAIDECTRVRFLGTSPTKGAEAAVKFLNRCVAFYAALGIKIKRAQSDNGTEFCLPRTEVMANAILMGHGKTKSIFTEACIAHGIVHRTIKPYSPELNGKVERSHGTDEKRFYSIVKLESLWQWERELKKWETDYNNRPHRSLNYKTPMQKLREKIEVKNQKPEEMVAA